MYSARARKREDVSRVTVIGFLICLLLLMSVSLLSLGVFNQPTLAGLKNPSMAGVLEDAVGTWGAILIYVGLIVSVGGGIPVHPGRRRRDAQVAGANQRQARAS